MAWRMAGLWSSSSQNRQAKLGCWARECRADATNCRKPGGPSCQILAPRLRSEPPQRAIEPLAQVNAGLSTTPIVRRRPCGAVCSCLQARRGGCSRPAWHCSTGRVHSTAAPAAFCPSLDHRLCHAAPFVGLASAAASPGFPTGRASRRVQYPMRAMDDHSSNSPSTLAQLQPMRRPAMLSQQREGQGQCQRQAHRCLADLSLHGLRQQLEPAGRRASRGLGDQARISGGASGERARAGSSPRLRRRGAETLDRPYPGIRRRRGGQTRALGEAAACAVARDRMPGTPADRAARRSPPGDRVADVAKLPSAIGEGCANPRGFAGGEPPAVPA